MAGEAPQSYSNHRKFVPLYHFGLTTILVVNLVWSLFRLVRVPTLGTAFDVALAVAFIGILLYARIFALKVQDRVIRLEEQLRFQALLPPDLLAHLGELRGRHYVGLRFASDEEVPDLVRRVLAGELSTADDIKKAVRTWRPDHFRC